MEEHEWFHAQQEIHCSTTICLPLEHHTLGATEQLGELELVRAQEQQPGLTQELELVWTQEQQLGSIQELPQGLVQDPHLW